MTIKLTTLKFEIGTDTSSTPAVKIQAQLESAGTDVVGVQVLYWLSNNEQTWVSLLPSGNGEWTCSTPLNMYAASGLYEIRAIRIHDTAGATVDISDTYLRTQGYGYQFEYVNPIADEIAPGVTELSFGSLVYAADGAIALPMTLTVSDDLSGVNQNDAVIEFISPTGASIQQRIYLVDDAWNGLFWLPASSPEGEYRLNTIRILDNAGNLNMNYGSMLDAKGLPSSVTIESNPNQDLSAPILTGLSISTAYATGGNPELRIRLGVSDLQSGIKHALVRMRDTISGSHYDKYLSVTSGTDLALAPVNSIVLGSDAPLGTYIVDFVLLTDNANNQIRLSGTELNAAGFQSEVSFPTEFTFSLHSDRDTVGEGESLTLTFDTDNVPTGTTFTYQLSGISSADIDGAPLFGTITTNDSGNAKLTFAITPDLVTEGNEEIVATVNLGNSVAAITGPITIFDTSTTDAIAPAMPRVQVNTDENGTVIGNRVALAGTAEPAARVNLFNGDELLGTTTASAQGGWQFTTDPVPNGTYRYAATATDIAGNTSDRAETATFTIASSLNIQGTSGTDLIHREPGGQHVHGGEGIDTLLVKDDLAQFSITKSGDVFKLLDQHGSDILTGVERIQFNDKTVALDIAGTGGMVYRLYQAAFNRQPDEAGVGFWIYQADKGNAMQTIADHFINSEEFKAMYGDQVDNVTFVSELYDNVLHRPAEAAGFDFWVGVLDRGFARAEVLAAFGESAENQAQVIGTIENGFAFIPLGGG